jgi:hypothetical protein
MRVDLPTGTWSLLSLLFLTWSLLSLLVVVVEYVCRVRLWSFKIHIYSSVWDVAGVTYVASETPHLMMTRI